MSTAMMFCPFCKEEIRQDALKCRYCQSATVVTPSAPSNDRLAELLLKWVGVVPLMMTLLLAVAGFYGWSSMSDVRKMVEKAEEAAKSIESKNKFIDKLVTDRIESHLVTLLNEISIDSGVPRAIALRKDLRELVDSAASARTAGESHQRRVLTCAEALVAYYDKRYDAATKLLQGTEDSALKFRLLGAVAHRQSMDATRDKRPEEAKRFAQSAYEHATRATEMARKERENRLLTKYASNQAAAAAATGRYDEAEKHFLLLIRDDASDLMHYYNIAALYSKWSKVDKALDYLELGAKRGLVEAGEFTTKDLNEDPDFQRLRETKDAAHRARLNALLRPSQ